MFENLEGAAKKYLEIEEKLADPSVWSDMENYRKLMKERKDLEPVVTKYKEYLKYVSETKEAEELAESADDPEFVEQLRLEAERLKEAAEKTSSELKRLLLPGDPNDSKNVIVEIRAGAGGEEAALFASSLFRMYGMYSERKKFNISVLNSNETELGGFREITFTVEGKGAYSRFKFESGVHRVQRVPETESQGRIHTSTATVAVLPEIDEVEIEIDPQDIVFETFKSSGAGGQHINKTSSAVRLIHKPTGIVTECQNERSQFRNRDMAMKMLRARLYEMKQSEREEKIASTRRIQIGSGDRSEKIRTYNYPQSRVTDHRIGLSLYSLETFLDGDLDAMIDALITADTSAKLQRSDI